MLHEFLHTNRDDLINRCRLKVTKRSSPPATAAELQYGVPLILDQLVEALRREEALPSPHEDSIYGFSPNTPGWVESGRTAALHGTELLRLGYTVDQVVHDYGDICQSVTELAKEITAPITVDEFHTFNRFLDNSIAEAVTAYGQSQHSQHSATLDEGAQDLHERLGTLADEQRILLDMALKALDALKLGNIGVMGATGTLLEDSLLKLRTIIDRSLPQIRTGSGMVTPSAP